MSILSRMGGYEGPQGSGPLQIPKMESPQFIINWKKREFFLTIPDILQTFYDLLAVGIRFCNLSPKYCVRTGAGHSSDAMITPTFSGRGMPKLEIFYVPTDVVYIRWKQNLLFANPNEKIALILSP